LDKLSPKFNPVSGAETPGAPLGDTEGDPTGSTVGAVAAGAGGIGGSGAEIETPGMLKDK